MQTREKSRGRVERRILSTSSQGVKHAQWPGLNRFLKLERITAVDGQTKHSVTYAVTSLTPDQADAATLLKMLRGGRTIERLFWVKDSVMREDHSRIRFTEGRNDNAGYCSGFTDAFKWLHE